MLSFDDFQEKNGNSIERSDARDVHQQSKLTSFSSEYALKVQIAD